MQAVAAGTISKASQTVLTGAFEFGELKVRQIMTPRLRVDYLSLNQPIGQVLRTVQKSAYTRLPLCDGDIDHVIGMVHMKDLFRPSASGPGKLRFSDQKTPAGEAIAIADGLPGSAVHVIGAGDIDLRKIKRDVLFVPELSAGPKACSGNFKPARFTWPWSLMNTAPRWASSRWKTCWKKSSAKSKTNSTPPTPNRS